MNRTKTMLLMVALMTSCGGSNTGNQFRIPEPTNLEVISFQELNSTDRNFTTVVECKNNGQDLKAVEVVVDLRDADGYVIGTGRGFIHNFKAGSTRTEQVTSGFTGQVSTYEARTGEVYRY